MEESTRDTEPNSGTVLVVEDERPLADLYTTWLSETHSVRTAYDGEQALEQLDEDVSVVLLDRRMPDVSGDEVLETIREYDYGCRVAMVTGVNPDFDIIGMGFDGYLTKPVTQDDLQEMVDSLLARETYSRQVQNYFALASKVAALEAEKPQPDLEANEDYREMKERVADKRDSLGTLIDDVGDDDVWALLRD